MRIPFVSLSLFGIAALLIASILVTPYFMMVLFPFGGPALIIGLLNLSLIALAIEALFGVTYRLLLAIPLLAYGIYFGAYVKEGMDIADYQARARTENGVAVVAYDPLRNDILTNDPHELVISSKVGPVYLSAGFRPNAETQRTLLADWTACSQLQTRRSAGIAMNPVQGHGWDQATPCVLSVPEKPRGTPIIVENMTASGYGKSYGDIHETAYRVIVRGQIVGTYRTATVRRMRPFPMTSLGCLVLFLRSKSIECNLSLRETSQTLDTRPPHAPAAFGDNPIAILLGIPALTADDKAQFVANDDIKAALNTTLAIAKVDDRRAFTIFDELERGQFPAPPERFAQLIKADPAWIEKNAGRMVSILERRLPSYLKDGRPAWLLQSIGEILATLPDDKLRPYASRLLRVVESDPEWRRQGPQLYVRVALAGTEAMDFYRRELFRSNVDLYAAAHAAEAICQAGTADKVLINDMKTLFASLDPVKKRPVRHGLFLALLRHGERDFVVAELTRDGGALTAWQTAVLKTASEDIYPGKCDIRGSIQDDHLAFKRRFF